MLRKRGYQYNFSASSTTMHDTNSRVRKAETMVAILNDYFDISLKKLRVLDVGASTGIIDNHLAKYFHTVQGIDIDRKAIGYA